MLWSLLAAAEKAQDYEAQQSCAVCGATGHTFSKIWELLLAIVGLNFTQHNEFAAVLSQWAVIMAHMYFSDGLYQMQCLPHFPPASIAYEIRSSSILSVHLHKDFMTAEMASQVQGWLRHNHGRPYMCKACSTLEVIARGPCAACSMAGKEPQPSSMKDSHSACSTPRTYLHVCQGLHYE